MKIIDHNLASIRYIAGTIHTEQWIECYLHESSLAAKRFTVVERHRVGNHDFSIYQFDDEAKAREVYDQAAVRVKEAIRLALLQP